MLDHDHSFDKRRWLSRLSLTVFLEVIFVLSVSGCASKPEAPVPLVLSSAAPLTASRLNEEGRRAYVSGDFARAKGSFAHAVEEAPDSGEAHYNLGLAMLALGETKEAREQFIEAANLSPGHDVIWDSPALRPYGTVKPEKKATGPPPKLPPLRQGGGLGMGMY